jgi:hypothetical protein
MNITGGYLIWKIPERKYFIDGRMPSWRQNNQFAFGDYIKVVNAEENFQEILEKYNIKIIVTVNKNKTKIHDDILTKFAKNHDWFNLFTSENQECFYEKLLNTGWRNVYQDDTTVILRK